MKVFSVGLNLDAEIDELKAFFVENADILCSVYYSLPLGKSFYTRNGLEAEYKGSDEKLLKIIGIIKETGIRTEVALNTRLSKDQLETAIEYMNRHHMDPDEIVCRNSSFPLLHAAYPKSEFISCYNNGTEEVLDEFNSIVLGQGYLRNPEQRLKWHERGYRIILMLNNGCSFLCDPRYCNQERCRIMYEKTRQKLSISQIYALQSFFPEELRALAQDPIFFSYRFKLSTRPFGLKYTRDALRAYAYALSAPKERFFEDCNNYLLFGALTILANNFCNMDYNEIVTYKKGLSPLKDEIGVI